MPTATPHNCLPLAAAADLQDHLLTAVHDLDRLQALLTDAGGALLSGFHGAHAELSRQGAGSPQLDGAITAMQFEDLASQLIQHTRQRLRHCADRLACDAMGDDDGSTLVEPAPGRANPVTQHEMHAGDVELF